MRSWSSVLSGLGIAACLGQTAQAKTGYIYCENVAARGKVTLTGEFNAETFRPNNTFTVIRSGGGRPDDSVSFTPDEVRGQNVTIIQFTGQNTRGVFSVTMASTASDPRAILSTRKYDGSINEYTNFATCSVW